MAFIVTPEYQRAALRADLAKGRAYDAAADLAPVLTPAKYQELKRALADGIITHEEARSLDPVIDMLKASRNPTVAALAKTFTTAAHSMNRAAKTRDEIQLANTLPDRGRVVERVVEYERPYRPAYRNFGPGAHTWDGRAIGSNSDTPGESLKHRLREAGNDAIVDSVRRQLGLD